MKCHQSGGSEALNNILGYCMEYAASPMLLVHPTSQAAEAYSKERLSDMIRTTPALRAVVQDKRMPGTDGRPESTLALKMFPGGFLALGGANSPNTFARWAVRLAIGDDVDRFPAVVGDEGDPGDLLVNRTTSFHDGLSIFVSTPTLKGGRIDTLYEQSDQRRYVVPCPACGRWDYLTWNDATHWRVAFDDRDPATARLDCPDEKHGGCGASITEAERPLLIAAGDWRSTATPQMPGLIGFHVPAMLSPFISLPDLVANFLASRARGRESLRVFFTTSIAEPWEDRGARMAPHALWTRREDYGADIEVPASAVFLTAGVDVQANRFEVLVLGWGPASERWVVDWREVPGDPRRPESFQSLYDALSRRYQHASGVLLPIHIVGIDSGYATDEVYDFALAQRRWVVATKGFAGRAGDPIVGKPIDPRDARHRRRAVRLYPLNVDDGKSEIMAALALPSAGPGAFHFPTHLDTVSEEFFAQLCAEHRETRYNKGGVATHEVWVLDRERNEALDCAVIALAMHRLANPNMRDLAERLQGQGPSRPPVTHIAGAPEGSPSTPARTPWLRPQQGWLR